MHCSGNPTCPERTSSSIHTTLLGLDWDSDDKSCRLFEHEVLEEAWRMGDDILAVNGQAIKCWVQQNVGSCVMWNPRVYPFIHCKGSREGTRQIMAFTTPHRTQSYWRDILGLCIVSWILQCLIKDRRLSYHSCMSARILQVHLPQLLGSEQNVDVPIPLSVDTLAWTSTVLPQTGVETTDLVLRKRQEEVIRSSHLISHTYVKVGDKGGEKIWAAMYIWTQDMRTHTHTQSRK